jgi:CRP/FNR family transcriptional regulator, cyclic AMP receptor protein
MHGPYGFDFQDSCESCKRRADGFFCQLGSDALADFNGLRSQAVYPAGAILFLEKQDPRGVFVLCGGQVKLSISSSGGKTLILRIAKAGEILGLIATMSGAPYEVTAETLHPCQVSFIRREDFLHFINKHPAAYRNMVRQLSVLYTGACEQLRTVGLSASAPEKLARLLLDWSADAGNECKPDMQIKMPLTHEEIAEFIGTTRETVTRTLSNFRGRRLVSLKGSTLKICDRTALEAIGGA